MRTEYCIFILVSIAITVLITQVIHWFNGGKTYKGWLNENKETFKKAIELSVKGNEGE